MGEQMKPGDRLELVGEGGTPFVVTVGAAWTSRAIEERLKRGEWRRPATGGVVTAPVVVGEGSPTSAREVDGPKPDGRPPQAAAKSAWVDYAVARGVADRETADAMTKQDLIEMTS
ncbi:hypothetical protein [Streptomyces bohaiensis]|uniref:hypothetical protein n=1 Tax=Streptomyces bohaiensis TaxID=1431344 RepID=UPI003B7E98A2